MKEKNTDSQSFSIFDLIEKGLHTNEVAYEGAKVLMDLHVQLNAIKNVVKSKKDKKGVYANDLSDDPNSILCVTIIDWMEQELKKIEKHYNKTLNVNHYER
jgi:hypothetical protein